MAATKPTTRIAGESVAFLLIIGAILVVANIVATNYSIGRFDLTRNQVYSLSRGSRNVVGRLDDTVTVRVYFTDNLPTEFADTERQVRDLLAEYKAASHGHLVVRYIRPDNEERQEQAERDGVRKVQHTVFRNDAREQVDGYRGLAIEYRGETKALPVIAGSEGLEYQITMLLRQLVGEKRKIGVVAGHGATATAGGLNTLKEYLPTYEFVDVDATQPIPSDIRGLLIVSPNSALAEAELRNIDAYVMTGGSLGVFGGMTKPIEGQLGQAPTVEPLDSGVNTLLDKWGIHVDSNVLADARCLPRGGGQMGMPQPYPVWAVAPFEAEAQSHPASYHLNQAILLYTSTLSRKTVPSGVNVRVLASSSRQSWKLTGSPISVDSPDWNSTVHEPFGPFPLIAAIEGRLPSAFSSNASTDAASETNTAPSVSRTSARVLVVGTGALFHEQFIPSTAELQDPRVAERAIEIISFSLNAIDWLANDNDLIAIRSKTIDAPMLDAVQNLQSTVASEERSLDPNDRASIERAQRRIETMQSDYESKKSRYRWGMTVGLPLLVVVFGIVRWQMRNRMKASLAA